MRAGQRPAARRAASEAARRGRAGQPRRSGRRGVGPRMSAASEHGPPGVGHDDGRQIRNARRDDDRARTGDQGGGGAIVAARSAGEITVTGALRQGRSDFGLFPRAAGYSPPGVRAVAERTMLSSVHMPERACPDATRRECAGLTEHLHGRPIRRTLDRRKCCARSRSSRGDRSDRDAGRGRANWTSDVGRGRDAG
jgi:hypothetical protein